MTLTLALIPVVLTVGLVSIPFSLIQRRLARRRWLQLLSRLWSRGRVVAFSDIREEADHGGGTLIVEFRRPKGPIRHWWTTENVYDLCPYPLGSSIDPFNSSPFTPAAQWCRDRYTDLRKGTAVLVFDAPALPPLTSDAPPDRVRWIEISPA